MYEETFLEKQANNTAAPGAISSSAREDSGNACSAVDYCTDVVNASSVSEKTRDKQKCCLVSGREHIPKHRTTRLAG